MNDSSTSRLEQAQTFVMPARAVSAEIEEKRSRFLCELAPVRDEASAREVVERARKEHWDARHHCSAFILGQRREFRRSSDDGEPSGTAGMPMLDVLVGSELTNVVAVVTRWFGGTLLGTGGLVKAYSDAVREALAAVQTVTYEHRMLLSVDVPVADVGRIEHAVRSDGVVVEGVEYASLATLTLAVPANGVQQLEQKLAALTQGTAAVRQSGTTWAKLDA